MGDGARIVSGEGQRCKTRLEASQRASHQWQSPRKSLKIFPGICTNLQEIWRNLWRNQICPEMTKKPSDPKSAVSVFYLILQAYSTDFRSCTFSRGGFFKSLCGDILKGF